MKTSMNNYIGDELANKVKILSKALFNAEKIVDKLQEENKVLLEALNALSRTDNNTEKDLLCI